MHGRLQIWRFAAAVVASMAALLVSEAGLRLFDGYELTSMPLTERDRARPDRARPPARHVDTPFAVDAVSPVPIPRGVNVAWFALDPVPPPAGPVDAELDVRYRRHRSHPLESVYEWNRAYVREAVCSRSPRSDLVFGDLTDVYVFDAPGGATRPAYRFLPRSHYPSGLRTNAWGWRGAEVEAIKPPHRIRIAFVGASTTIGAHADPASYPEHVARWLEEWARANHPHITIDVINAGREGVDSSSIAAIVEQEVVPMGPDVVVYYEGANQFWPTDFVANDVPIRLLRTMIPRRWLETHSALGARLVHVGRRLGDDGGEPAKPPVWVRWPADLDERDPPLDDPRLPVQLPAILSDLDRIRHALDEAGATLVLSSFVWVVHEGLVVDRTRDALLYDQLNQYYWPFSYAHLRRYVDFENRVFRKYAAAHALPFVDLDGAYPRDPRLFVDAVHMTPAGVKLQAWIVLQQIVTVLDTQIASGRWPSPPRATTTAAPGPPAAERRLVRLDEIRASCR